MQVTLLGGHDNNNNNNNNNNNSNNNNNNNRGNIFPNGGEKWWCTMVESAKNHLNQTQFSKESRSRYTSADLFFPQLIDRSDRLPKSRFEKSRACWICGMCCIGICWMGCWITPWHWNCPTCHGKRLPKRTTDTATPVRFRVWRYDWTNLFDSKAGSNFQVTSPFPPPRHKGCFNSRPY